MNVLKIVRSLFGLGVFVAFIVTTFQALIHLIECKIGTSERTEEREEMILPSWTLCPFENDPANVLWNASNLHELTKVWQKVPLNFSISLNKSVSFDMTDKTTLEDKFNVTLEETWHVHCKTTKTGNGCDTCLTFNAPIKTIPKYFAKLSFGEYPGTEVMILQLHGSGNSLSLNWEFNWSQMSYFVLKKGKT